LAKWVSLNLARQQGETCVRKPLFYPRRRKRPNLRPNILSTRREDGKIMALGLFYLAQSEGEEQVISLFRGNVKFLSVETRYSIISQRGRGLAKFLRRVHAEERIYTHRGGRRKVRDQGTTHGI